MTVVDFLKLVDQDEAGRTVRKMRAADELCSRRDAARMVTLPARIATELRAQEAADRARRFGLTPCDGTAAEAGLRDELWQLQRLCNEAHRALSLQPCGDCDGAVATATAGLPAGNDSEEAKSTPGEEAHASRKETQRKRPIEQIHGEVRGHCLKQSRHPAGDNTEEIRNTSRKTEKDSRSDINRRRSFDKFRRFFTESKHDPGYKDARKEVQRKRSIENLQRAININMVLNNQSHHSLRSELVK